MIRASGVSFRRAKERGSNQTLMRPSHEQERIDSALRRMVLRTNRSLSSEQIEMWHNDLSSYPVGAIEWAFDVWSRNSSKLPALGDIVALLNTWHVENAPEPGEELEAQRNTGYGRKDVLWLFKKVCAFARDKEKRPSNDDWLRWINELDQRREGGRPSGFADHDWIEEMEL